MGQKELKFKRTAVKVGFLYTEVEILPLLLTETLTSKNGIEDGPISIVNLRFGCCRFKKSRKELYEELEKTQNTSSI